MAIKNRLKSIRHELEIDQQKDMAELLEIQHQLYNRYELQRTQPTLETALRIAKKLKKPVEEIFLVVDNGPDK